MVKRGSVCNHPSRPEIDRGLRRMARLSTLAGQFGLSPAALCRHRKHLARALDAHRRREAQFYLRARHAVARRPLSLALSLRLRGGERIKGTQAGSLCY